MLKYTLLTYFIIAIAMVYFANKMLDVKKNLEKKVLGIYTQQYEEINQATGMEVYNVKNDLKYEDALKALEEIQ